MYLLAIVTLIVGILSIYAQILSLQAARIAANQTGFAQIMMQWHGGAVAAAAASLKGGWAGTACYLGPAIASVSSCPSTVTLAVLPSGYNNVSYQFYSVLYKDATTTQPYVVTFVAPPTASYGAGGGGYITLANGHTTSVSMGDLMQQFQVAGIPTYLYGTVDTSGTLHTVAALQNTAGTGVNAVYTIPAGIGVLPGDFAVASSPIGF